MSLFLRGANIEAGSLPNELRDAVMCVDLEAIRSLLPRCSSLMEVPDSTGKTLLHYAIERRHPDVVNVLLEQMSKEAIAIKDKHGKTALHLAAKQGMFAIVRALLPKMRLKTVLEEDEDCLTAMELAASEHHGHIVDIIRNHCLIHNIVDRWKEENRRNKNVGIAPHYSPTYVD